MKPTIVEFVTDPQLLGLSLSDAQECLLRSIYGLPLSGDQLELWRACTGRETYSGKPYAEVTVVAGARAGKDSRIAAPIVCYEALFGGHEEQLSRGERGMVPLVAQDSRAAGIAFGYVRSYLEGSPLLAGRVERVLTREIELTNGITVACFPCTLRSLRGWSIPVGVMDELGFYRLEGQADSDAEIQTSLRRGQLSFPAPRLVKISTPYLKSGVLWEDFSRHFGEDNPDILVWRASSALMNPTLRGSRLEQVKRLDPLRFSREYEAEFSDDLTAFLPFEWVDDAVQKGRRELPPRNNVTYYGACDPSGGGQDAFTVAIVHLEQEEGAPPRIVQDVLRGWRRKGKESPDLRAVVGEIAGLLRDYLIGSVVGDRYAAAWVSQAFGEEGTEYIASPWSKAQAYLEVLPVFSQGRLEILDHPQLVRELQCLERRTRAGGKDIVDHPRGGHDDYANVLALAAASALSAASAPPLWEEIVLPPGGDPCGFFTDNSLVIDEDRAAGWEPVRW